MNSEERLARATEWFVRVRADDAQDADRASLKQWLEEHPDNAKAYREASAAWDVVGEYASAPELMVGRRDALEDARRAGQKRESLWSRWRPGYGVAASIVGALLVSFLLWQGSVRSGDVYETGVGDRRMLTLSDGSTVNLDARSRLRVSFRNDVRHIDLEAGQASFEVAKDPARPFRVRAGEHTVIALGTEFNVEIVRETLLVTLLEGRVAVVDDTATTSAAAQPAELLIAGQQLVATRRERPRVRNDIDLGRATAWQDGKLFFNDEPLATAAERMNRYGHLQILVDPAVEHIGISGVFKAGDTSAFMDAVTTYFPVRAERIGASQVRLVPRQ